MTAVPRSAASAATATDLVHFGHRFDDDEASVAQGWTRTLNWFASHMR